MAKRLMAKTGTYMKDGAEKGEYVKIGVILSNDNGEYMLLDPAVSLAGVLAKQNAMAMSQGKPVRDNIMASIFDDNAQHGQQQQHHQHQQPQGGHQQQRQQQNTQQPQGGYNGSGNGY